MTALWPNFEPWWVFKPTGGSPDVVHLIRYASERLGWLMKVTTVLEVKETIVWTCTNFSDFWPFWGGLKSVNLFSQSFLIKQVCCFCAHWKGNFLESFLPKAQRSFKRKNLTFGWKPCNGLKRASKKLKGTRKGYRLLITFSLIMLDSPRLLLLLSTWEFYVLGG